jgi:FdhD protein
MALAATTPLDTLRYDGNGFEPRADEVVTEEPLEVRLNGESLAVTMRTPGDDRNLAAGFLFTEGIIGNRNDILSIEEVETAFDRTPGNVIDIHVRDALAEGKAWARNFYATSSCGVCGKASIDRVLALQPRVRSELQVSPALLLALPNRLRAAQSSFLRTGGLHATGLFDAEGSLRRAAEDVGRHNALDKVIGWGLFHDEDFGRDVAQVSGRAGFEIVQKCAVAGIPILSAVGAPSSLAVDLAARANVGLAGFVRAGTFNVYAGAARFRPA